MILMFNIISYLWKKKLQQRKLSFYCVIGDFLAQNQQLDIFRICWMIFCMLPSIQTISPEFSRYGTWSRIWWHVLPPLDRKKVLLLVVQQAKRGEGEHIRHLATLAMSIKQICNTGDKIVIGLAHPRHFVANKIHLVSLMFQKQMQM